MYAKLKSRINKLYGKNIWQGLSKHDKDMLRLIGAYRVWQLRTHGSGKYIMIDNVIAWAESAKVFKEMNEYNVQMAKEMEPLVFETMGQLNAEEVGE